MSYIEWSKEFETGLATIDFQHRKLVNYINDIQKASLDENELSRNMMFEVTIGELVKYTQFHFSQEEEWMEKCHYNLMAEHKEHHEKLKGNVIKFVSEFKSGTLDVNALLDFLKKWLYNHINGEDRKYVEDFKKNGLGGNDGFDQIL